MLNVFSKPIAFLGAGSWGTALALNLARRGQCVKMWSVDPTEIDALIADKSNKRFLPGFEFPDLIQPTKDLSVALADVEDVLMVVPSVGFRNTLNLIKPLITPDRRIISASKGIDAESGKFLNHLVEEIFGKQQAFAVLSGPTFAREVAAGLPAAVMIASEQETVRVKLIERFDSPSLRAYPSDDVIGVEIGGVVKNVIAIATGISDGMALGANMRSALITLGLAEIARLGLRLGAKLETIMGLAGMGDLILTCADVQSRNHRFGLAIGKGAADLAAAEREIGQAVEGKRNAELVVKMAQQLKVEMPICETVWQILQGKLNVHQSKDEMLTRMFRKV